MATRRKLKWNGKKIIQKTVVQVERNMGAVTQFMRNEVIKSINTSQPTRRQASGRRVGLSPSQPGQPPKRIEGDLVRSIIAEVETKKTKVVGRYGSTQREKSKALELGTSRMGARPFLRPPLHKNRKAILRILSR